VFEDVGAVRLIVEIASVGVVKVVVVVVVEVVVSREERAKPIGFVDVLVGTSAEVEECSREREPPPVAEVTPRNPEFVAAVVVPTHQSSVFRRSYCCMVETSVMDERIHCQKSSNDGDDD